MAGLKKVLFTSAVWNIANILITAIGAFVTMPIIINGIGTDNYGLFSIILMIGGFAALQDFGLGEATLRYVSLYSKKNDLKGINRVIQSSLTVYLITISVVFFLIQVFALQIINLFELQPDQVDIGLTAIRLGAFSFFLSTLDQAMQKIPEALLRYDLTNKANICFAALRFSLMVAAIKLGYGLIGLVVATIIISTLRLIWFFFLSQKLIPGVLIYPTYSKKGIKEVFNFSIYSFINQIISQGAQNADRIILGVFFGTSAVGFLSAPKDLIQRASGVTGAAGKALFPAFSSMDNHESMAKLYSQSLWLLSLMTMVLLIPLAIIIPDFLSLWISPNFSENSAEFARLFSIGLSFNGGVVAYFSLLKGTNRINWLTKIMTTLTIVSTGATVVLVHNYGLLGAGVKPILFSWLGIVICIVVGKKIFKDKYQLKDMAEFGLVLPISGITVFFIGTQITTYFILSTWLNLITAYVFFAVLLASLAFLTNLTFFKKKGVGYCVFHSTVTKIKLKRLNIIKEF